MWRKPFLLFLFLVVCLSCGQGLRRSVGGSGGSDVGEGGGDGGGGEGDGGGGGGPTGDFTVDPTSGPQRTVLTLTGTDFVAPISITVGGVTCRSPTVVSSTEAWCVTNPLELGVHDIVVTQGLETKSLEGGFTTTANLYIAAPTEDKIYQYEISGSGGLTPLDSPFIDAAGINFLFYPPTSALFYALNQGASTISTYTFHDTGELTELTGSPDAAGPLHFAAVADGMAVFQATNDGSFTDVTSYFYFENVILSQGNQHGSGRAPGKTVIAPDGISLYTTLHNGGNALAGFQITSMLTLNEYGTSPYASSATPGDTVVSSDNKFVFQIDTATPSLFHFTRNTTTGELSGGTQATFSSPGTSLLFVHPTKRCLYALHDGSNQGKVMTWDETTGAPTDVASSTFTDVTGPQSMAFDPVGNFAFVANGGSANVSRFSVGSDCRLTFLGRTAAGAANEGAAVR